MLQYPVINGLLHSYSDVEISLNDQTFRGVKEINYNDKLEPGMAKGTDPQLLGATRGDWSGSANATLYRREFEVLKATLGAAGVGFGETVFSVKVTYSPVGAGLATYTDTIKVRIQSPDSSNTQGNDPSAIKLEFFLMEPILWNGVPIVTPRPQSPT
jgi:hypothetical protein